jgi:hypothetical protein
MTTPESITPEVPEFEAVPPSQAPQLVPWNENTTFLSPGGAVAGISAFAASATSPGRSRRSKLFIRIVVAIILISLVAGSVWRVGGGFL